MKQNILSYGIVLFFIGVAGVGYVAWKNLNQPSDYITAHQETLGDLSAPALEETEEDDTSSRTDDHDMILPTSPSSQDETTSPSSSSVLSTYRQQILQLIDQKKLFKKGDQGPSIGLIQQVMNAYFGTQNKIDNDFGTALQTVIKKFQQQNGVTTSGQVGPQTLQKMAEWLAKKS